MYRGELSPAKVLRLLVRLPKESRFVRAVGGASHEWGTEAYLLAQAVDLLAGGNYQRGGGRGRRPKPVPRPADSKKPLGGKHTRKVSQRDVKNFFATRKAVADG